MAETLLQLHVSEVNGGNSSVTRTLIVNQTITFFNLHRALQYCIKPRQSDSTADGKAYTFAHKSTKAPIKATKSAQLNKNSSITSGSAKVGHKYTYTAEDKSYHVEVTDICGGDGRYFVPRCIAGKNGNQQADLNVINGKLLVRKFTKAGAGQKKNTAPAIITSHEANLNAMKQPLRFWEEASGSREVQLMKEGSYPRSYLVQQAIKYAGPEAAAKVAGTEEEERERDRLFVARTSGLPAFVVDAVTKQSQDHKAVSSAAAASQPAQPDANQATSASAAAVPTQTEQPCLAATAAASAVEKTAERDTAQKPQEVADSTAAAALESADVPPASDQLPKSSASDPVTAAAGSGKLAKKPAATAAGAAQGTLLTWLKK